MGILVVGGAPVAWRAVLEEGFAAGYDVTPFDPGVTLAERARLGRTA